MRAASKLKSKTEKIGTKLEMTETKLQQSGNSLHAFLEALRFWENSKAVDLFYVRCLWERCVAVHFLVEGVWEKYIVFLMNKMKVAPVVMGVANRAVRNCNWSGELWGHRLRIGEMFGETEDEVNDVFARAYSFVTESKSADQMVILMKHRCGLVRRRVVEDSSSQTAAEALRNAHEEALIVFREAFGQLEDFRLEQESIHDELHLFNNVARARSIFDTLLLSHPSSPTLAVLVSTFERNHGRDLPRAFWVLRQCLAKLKKDEEKLIILDALVKLEGECGGDFGENSGGYYDVLGKKMAVEWGVLKRGGGGGYVGGYQQPVVQDVQMQETGWPTGGGTNGVHGESNKRGLEEPGSPKRAKKAKKLPEGVVKGNDEVVARELDYGMDVDTPAAVAVEETKPAVKKEFYTLDDTNAGNIIRLVGVNPETDCEFFKTLFGPKPVPVDYFLKAQDDGTTDGFIEFPKAQDAITAALRGKVKVFGDLVAIERCIPLKRKWGDLDESVETAKVFINNVDRGVHKPLLRKVFGVYGKLREVRLVTRETIAFAYIEFETRRSAEKAIEGMDGKSIEGFPGRKVGVAFSDKAKAKKRVVDSKELIVTNFSIATTKEDLMALFEKHGKVKDIRILVDATGVSRGVGFAEFEDEASAKSALQVNGTEVDGRFIGVAPSDPNVRGGAHLHKKEPQYQKHDGNANIVGAAQRGRPGLGHAGRGGRGGKGRGGGGSGTLGATSAAAPAVTVSSFVPRTAGRGKGQGKPGVGAGAAVKSGSGSMGPPAVPLKAANSDAHALRKKPANTDDLSGSAPSTGQASSNATPPPGTSAGHAPVSQGFGDMLSAGLRGTIAGFKNHDSKDLEVFIKEDRDVVDAQTSLMRQRKGAADYFHRWAATKEEDIRMIGGRWVDIQEALIVAENEYVESLEHSRVRMKVIRNREKAIGDAKGKLKTAISKRDAAQKKQQPAEELIQAARDIQAHIRELEAEHLGLTRLDLRDALRIKHEASIKYAVKLSVASNFSIHLADQIPQGTMLPGQDLPSFAGGPTLDQIMADFKDAFASDELVTVVRTEVPAPTLLPVAVDNRPPSVKERVDSNSVHSAEQAVVYAAPRPQNYGSATLPNRLSNLSMQQPERQRTPSPIGYKLANEALQQEHLQAAAPPAPQPMNPPTRTYSASQADQYTAAYYAQYYPQQPAPPPPAQPYPTNDPYQQAQAYQQSQQYQPQPYIPPGPQQPIIYPGPPPSTQQYTYATSPPRASSQEAYVQYSQNPWDSSKPLPPGPPGGPPAGGAPPPPPQGPPSGPPPGYN
ncbi:Splicing factor [Podochytrium sp. JEL0797]|nr:Splicing factor [Podochytrium sp. JEL0797]